MIYTVITITSLALFVVLFAFQIALACSEKVREQVMNKFGKKLNLE